MKRWHPVMAMVVLSILAVSPAPSFAQTDHFKCYQATEQTLEQPVDAELNDQFGDQPDIQILNAVWFCNPVAKTVGEESPIPITEPQNHLTLYPIAIKEPAPRRLVTVENQFGTFEIVVTAPRLVAVPTQKNEVPPPLGISHFKCYEAGGPALHVPATLVDQFHTEEVMILQPRFFCNPAEKVIDEVTTPPEPGEAHLTCYKIAPGEQPDVEFIDISNQIDEEDMLQIGPSNFICVPGAKLEVRQGGRRVEEGGEPVVVRTPFEEN